MENSSEISLILQEIKSIKEKLDVSQSLLSDWIPRQEIMKFLGYQDTAMGTLELSGKLVVARVGNKKFITRKSLLALLEENIQPTNYKTTPRKS